MLSSGRSNDNVLNVLWDFPSALGQDIPAKFNRPTEYRFEGSQRDLYCSKAYFDRFTPDGMLLAGYRRRLVVDGIGANARQFTHRIINPELRRARPNAEEFLVELIIPNEQSYLNIPGKITGANFHYGDSHIELNEVREMNGRLFAVIPSSIIRSHQLLELGYLADSAIIYTSYEDTRGQPAGRVAQSVRQPRLDIGALWPELNARIQQIQQLGVSPRLQMKELELWISQNFEYSLDRAVLDEYLALQDMPVIEKIMRLRKGCCTEMAWLFAFIARSVFVMPCRVVNGTKVDGNSLKLEGIRNNHTWNEVYFEGEGWVRFDPTEPEGFLVRMTDDIRRELWALKSNILLFEEKMNGIHDYALELGLDSRQDLGVLRGYYIELMKPYSALLEIRTKINSMIGRQYLNDSLVRIENELQDAVNKFEEQYGLFMGERARIGED